MRDTRPSKSGVGTQPAPPLEEHMSAAMLELDDGSVALIDPQDVARVAVFDWQLPRDVGERYVVGYRFGEERCPDIVYLHRLIADACPEDIVAHRNGDPLDNRRDNLLVFRRDRMGLYPTLAQQWAVELDMLVAD
jgi:hypothetical protein